MSGHEIEEMVLLGLPRSRVEEAVADPFAMSALMVSLDKSAATLVGDRVITTTAWSLHPNAERFAAAEPAHDCDRCRAAKLVAVARMMVDPDIVIAMGRIVHRGE